MISPEAISRLVTFLHDHLPHIKTDDILRGMYDASPAGIINRVIDAIEDENRRRKIRDQNRPPPKSIKEKLERIMFEKGRLKIVAALRAEVAAHTMWQSLSSVEKQVYLTANPTSALASTPMQHSPATHEKRAIWHEGWSQKHLQNDNIAKSKLHQQAANMHRHAADALSNHAPHAKMLSNKAHNFSKLT